LLNEIVYDIVHLKDKTAFVSRRCALLDGFGYM